MAQVMDPNVDFDGSFWPADAFKGADEETSDDEGGLKEEEEEGQVEAEQNQEQVQGQPDWQEAQKNKLQNIISRRRKSVTVEAPDPEVIRKCSPTREKSYRRSRSHGDKESQIGPPPPLRRVKTRESVSPTPKRTRERSPNSTNNPRDRSPRERTQRGERSSCSPGGGGGGRKVRTKKPPRRCQSIDGTKNILDQDSLNGSMEFDVKDISPVARHNNRRASGARLNASAPRLMAPRNLSPDGAKEARRQKLMKRKNLLKAGSLRRLMDAENNAGQPKELGDEISIDDTVLMDESDEHKLKLAKTRKAQSHSLLGEEPHKASSKSRRGQRTSVADEDDTKHSSSKSRRGRRTVPSEQENDGVAWRRRGSSRSPAADDNNGTKSRRGSSRSPAADDNKNGTKGRRRGSSRSPGAGGEEKSRRGRRSTSVDGDEFTKSRRSQRTTGAPNKRDQLRKTHSEKPERSRHRRKSFTEEESAGHYSSKSFSHKSSKVQRMKELGEQHHKVRQKMQKDGDGEEKEMTLEELVPSNKSLRKSRSTGDESCHNSRTKSGIENLANMSISRNHASKSHDSFDVSFGASFDASSDLKENPKTKGTKYSDLSGQLAQQPK